MYVAYAHKEAIQILAEDNLTVVGGREMRVRRFISRHNEKEDREVAKYRQSDIEKIRKYIPNWQL